MKSLFRSTTPISSTFGFSRGKPIDRYYMEEFIGKHKEQIHGTVLEVADNYYSNTFGTGPIKSEIIDVTKNNKNATIIGDLTDIATLPHHTIDCFICTQTLNFIYDIKSAIEGMHYLLKPGGTLLLTVSGLAHISRYDMDKWGDYWRFTELSITKLFSEVFGAENISLEQYGNYLSVTSQMNGLASHELTKGELDCKDKDYPLIIAVIARKK